MTLRRPPAEWLSRNAGQNFVLLHGLAMAPVFWRLFAPAYVYSHNAVAYPLPGHCPWILEEAGATLCTDAIIDAYAAAILADFDGRKVTLVGHSTGGFLALLIAARRPDLVRSVVIMGGFACGRFEGRERVAAKLLRLPTVGQRLFLHMFQRWISNAEQFRYGSIECVYDKSCPWETPESTAIMEDVRQHLMRSRPGDIGAVVNWIQRSSHLDLIREIGVPVLNLIGAHDAVVPPSHQLRISRLLPNVQTVLFGKSGHLLMVEQQEKVNDVFSRFARNPFLPAMAAIPSRALAPEPRGADTWPAFITGLLSGGTKTRDAHL